MALSPNEHFLGSSFEIMNSAIENVVDLASHYHFLCWQRKPKDMAAGAVLVVSFAAMTGALSLSHAFGIYYFKL